MNARVMRTILLLASCVGTARAQRQAAGNAALARHDTLAPPKREAPSLTRRYTFEPPPLNLIPSRVPSRLIIAPTA